MKKNDPGLVAFLEPYDGPAVSEYREAVRLYMFYSESPFSFRPSKASKEQAIRWRNTAHRILSATIDNLKRAG